MAGALFDSLSVAPNSTTIVASATSSAATTIPNNAEGDKPRYIRVTNMDAAIVVVVSLNTAGDPTDATAGTNRGMPVLPGESVLLRARGAASLNHEAVSGTPLIAITPLEE